MHPFPLPTGHVFGPPNGALHWHTGRDDLTDSQWLKVWQDAYRQKVNRSVRPDQIRPVFDGSVQAAVIDVQRRTGLPVTGLLDPDTWAAVWAYSPPQRVAPEVPKQPKGGRQLRHGSRKSWDYWRRFSNHNIQYGEDPAAPPWWPGRPFGPHEKGWHVREIQELLDVKPTGTYNRDTQRRVAGVQRVNDLPVSGIVDRRTALLIDPGPWASPA